MEKITITLASAADADFIAQLGHTVWWQTYPHVTGNEQVAFMLGQQYTPKALQRQMRWQGQIFWLAALDGLPVGFCAYGQRMGAGCTWVHLHKLYVDLAARGHGLGGKLVELAADYAMQRGIPSIRLNVNRGNPAVGFYERAGFHIRQRLDIPYGPYLLTDYIMEKAV